MKEAIKVNKKGPRYRAPRLNTLSAEWLSEIAKSKDSLVKDQKTIKKIVIACNELIAKSIIDTRDGIELPEQLGYMFLGTCQPKIRKNVDFKTTDNYLKVIQHRNWESDNYLAKIFYSNYETKYKFKFNDLWAFKGCREFTKAVGVEYPKNWKKYIQVDHTLKIASLYRSSLYQEERKIIDQYRLQDYNPLEL
jgi:hypothetical protein